MLLHQEELKRMTNLLKFCDQMKVYFRSQNNTIAEELYAHLEFKVGIMTEMTSFYMLHDEMEGHPSIQRYHGEESSLNDMKIYEVQNLLLTHFISIIESSLRKFLLANGVTNKMIILHQILEYLYKHKYINEEELHLWSGIRQIRNAVTHYEHHSHVSDTYHFSQELEITLKNAKAIESHDLFSDLKLMEWMAYSVKNILT